MPVTKVRSRWTNGQLAFGDSTGSTGLRLDSTGKALKLHFWKLDVTGGSTNLSITGVNIGNLKVSSGKIAASAITSGKLAPLSVKAAKVAANAVGSSAIGAIAVTAAKVKASAVGSSAIASLAVTAAKVAANAIASSSITTGVIGQTKLKSGILKGTRAAIIPDNGTTSGVPVQFVIKTTAVSTAAAATTTTLKTITVTEALRVIDLWVVQTSGAGASSNFTIRVRKGTNAISNAMGCKTADFAVLRPTALGSNANRKFAVGSTIQIRGANASSKAVKSVYVMIRAIKSS